MPRKSGAGAGPGPGMGEGVAVLHITPDMMCFPSEVGVGLETGTSPGSSASASGRLRPLGTPTSYAILAQNRSFAQLGRDRGGSVGPGGPGVAVPALATTEASAGRDWFLLATGDGGDPPGSSGSDGAAGDRAPGAMDMFSSRAVVGRADDGAVLPGEAMLGQGIRGSSPGGVPSPGGLLGALSPDHWDSASDVAATLSPTVRHARLHARAAAGPAASPATSVPSGDGFNGLRALARTPLTLAASSPLLTGLPDGRAGRGGDGGGRASLLASPARFDLGATTSAASGALWRVCHVGRLCRGDVCERGRPLPRRVCPCLLEPPPTLCICGLVICSAPTGVSGGGWIVDWYACTSCDPPSTSLNIPHPHPSPRPRSLSPFQLGVRRGPCAPPSPA
jgi:hypothetical protein